MKICRLGRSPLFVSDICMGTMTFGNQADEAMAFRVLDNHHMPCNMVELMPRLLES